MPKTTVKPPSALDLERIYAEVEARVNRSWEERFRKLERENERLREDRDLWQKKYFDQVEVSERLMGQLDLAHKKIDLLEKKVEHQENRISALLKQLHGKKSEVAKPEVSPEPLPQKRARGRQKGAKGHGRKKREALVEAEVIHDFEPGERCCEKCGMEYAQLGEQRSEEIDVEYRLVKLVHKRKKIVRTCKCKGSPPVKTAKGPAKLAAGGMFTTRFWSYFLFEKFQLQRPTHRVRQLWKVHGLDVSQGTITNGLKRLHDRNVFRPLAEAIRARIRDGTRQQSDETGWKVFQEIEGKDGHQHWLWVTLGSDATAFRVEQTRSKDAALKMIGKQPIILTSDRLSSYHNLGDNVMNSWCWAHIRREFLALANQKKNEKLGKRWVAMIDELYHLNNSRLKVSGKAFEELDEALKAAVGEFERRLKRNVVRKELAEEVRSLFKNIAKDWDGLTVFVNCLEIPMDNNASERALRNSVVGRKNYYGSGSKWSADLTADLFSILATLKMHDVNQLKWLEDYLQAVAKNGGKVPEDYKRFLPWNNTKDR